MRKLLLGVREFHRTRRPVYAATFAELARGQKPETLAIACSDSRVSPVEFASSEPGDVFVVRNVGNLVPRQEIDVDPDSPSTGAAIEYALAMLPIHDIVVCGHSGCGAIHAIHDGHIPPGAPHLAAWLQHGRRVLEEIPAAPPGVSLLDHLSQQSVLRQLENLRTYPAVRRGEHEGRLRLTAWWLDIARAEVLDYDDVRRQFVALDDERVARLLADREARGPQGSP